MSEYFLSKGRHSDARDGRCAMEWVSYLAGERHSDHPECVSPVLARFCTAVNDALPDDERQKLRPYLARTIGTRDDGLDGARSWLATDWLIRTVTPVWLALAGLDASASQLRALAPVLTEEDLNRATVHMRAVSSIAPARRDHWQSRGAAKAAAWPIAGVAATGAIRDGAWDAAWAASAVTEDDLAPALRELQRSALDLLDRMLPTESVQFPVVPDADMVTAALPHT